MSASATCPHCKGEEIVVERDSRIAMARACSCVTPCRHCLGTGYVRQLRIEGQKDGRREYEQLAVCSCRIREKHISNFNKMALPGVLATATFENYLPPSAEHARPLEVARDFAHNYKHEKLNKGFILSGSVGTGKTHLLVATLRYLTLQHRIEAAYIEMSLLYATIRRGFAEGKSGGEIIQPLSEVEVLAIDELGRGRGSPFERETLDELIARRYNAGLSCIFATNYSLSDPDKTRKPHSTREIVEGTRESQYLSDQVGERVFSRLAEMCTFVVIPPGTQDQRLIARATGRSRTYRGR